MTFRKRQWQLREEMILEAADDLVNRRGYALMSMDDVAARVGISKATLYQHFPSKEDLAISMIVRQMSRAEAVLETQDPSAPAILRLENALRMAIRGKLSMSAAGVNLPPGLFQSHPLAVAKGQRMTALLTDLVDAAKEEGDIDPSIPTAVIVRVFQGAVRGANYQDLVDTGEMDLETLAETLVTLMYHGIRRRH